MKIITFDIEEWYTEFNGLQRPEEYALFDEKLEQILDSLDGNGIKGTFFCVGQMAVHFPKVIKKIVYRGHEIGCHSNVHHWLNKMNYDECLQDTKIAVDSLEQCIGKKVRSYRAPAFSIGNNNKWAFEILAECGIERDSSVFPAKRDCGGFPCFGQQQPCIIRHKGITIKEYPIPMTTLFGKKVAYSGGGYFRLFPLWYVKYLMEKNDYSMTYFHIRDLIVEKREFMTREAYESYFKEDGTLKRRFSRYIKSNLGKNNAFPKLSNLISSIGFVNLDYADNLIIWDNQKTIEL